MRLTRLGAPIQNAHDSSVWSLAWCPDQTLLTGSLDESVSLWTEDPVATLHKKHSFIAHGLGSVDLAVHRDGRYAATSCLDGCVRVWDIHDPSKKLHRFQAAASENWGIDFAPVMERVVLAAAGGMTSTISIYTMGEETKKQMTLNLPRTREGETSSRKHRSSFVLACVFSPDGKWIAGTCDNGLVTVFDAETGNAVHTLSDNTTPVRTAVFSPDSEVLVTGSDAATLTMYDVRSGTVTASIDSRSVVDSGSYEDPSMFLDLSFHPSGTHFASSTAHGKVYLWDASTKERVQVLDDHSDAVWCGRFSPDGTKFASACDDGSIGLFSVAVT